MKPIITKLLIILNRANSITTSPEVLKKTPDFEVLCMLNELKLMRARTGNVPRAKNSIISPPLRKLPVVNV